MIPSGVELPAAVEASDEPPHILYVGRLAEEKGIRELVQAAAGLELVVVGDGPLRGFVPGAVGFVPHHELAGYYKRAAVVCVPSRREGYGVVAREAMAHGRAVVTTGVGGLADAVDDGVTGLVVPPGDVPSLREALERLLADPDLRNALGTAAREKAREAFAWPAATAATIAAYREAASDSTA